MKRYNTIIEGAKEPENTNDLWIKDRKLKLFLNGIWKNIIGEADIKTNKEDLNINEEGNLELANREYEPSNFSGKGYKILRKNIQDGKNILTQEMINKPNLIYEIRYDFDLNGEDITIPEGCTLKFEGGKLSNGTLHGNNTKIIADSSDHIFNYDRTKNYIDGTWKINKWYCAWFGTVADGKAYRAKYDDSGQLVKDNADTYFEVIIEGTDNYLPIQEALDTSMFMRNGSIVDCHFYTNNPTFTRNSCLFFNPIFPAFSYYREIGDNFTNCNRFNNIWNYLGNNNFIITKNTRHSKELTHTSYSFNEDTGILELQTDWIGSAPSYDKTIAVGDLIYQFLKETIYVIVKIIPSEDNNNATVLCTPVCGFRKKDNKYICRGAIDNSRWAIFTTRLKTFDKPLVISSREDKVLTLREWDDTLKAGIGLSKYHDYEHSFQFEAGLIESVNKESKTITLKYNYHLDDTFKVINGYLVAEEDANFWKGTWVQDIINQYNNL